MSTQDQVYFKVSPTTVDQPFGQYNSSTSCVCVCEVLNCFTVEAGGTYTNR